MATKPPTVITPAKVGRPTRYKKEHCQLLVDHMSTGLSFECFCGSIGVGLNTTKEWAKNNKEFRAAKELGTAQCRLFWEKIGRSGSLGHIKNFSASAYIFNMKNRFDWSDRTDLKIGEDTNNYDEQFSLLRDLTRADLVALAKGLTPDSLLDHAKDVTPQQAKILGVIKKAETIGKSKK